MKPTEPPTAPEEEKPPTLEERIESLETRHRWNREDIDTATDIAARAARTIRRYEVYGAIVLAMIYGAALYHHYARR